MRRLIAVDLLILDDFGLDALDSTESRDIYEVLLDRHQRCSTIVTSNRASEEWLLTMTDARWGGLSAASEARTEERQQP